MPFAERRLYRLACRPGRAAETCLPGNHRIHRRHRKTRHPSRRGTRQHPPSCPPFVSSRLGHGSDRVVHRAYFRDPCTGMHKRKISAGAEVQHNHNISLLLRRNWLRSAKPRATRPHLCASQAPLARNQNRPAPPKTRRLASSGRTGSSFFRCTPGALLPRRPSNSRGRAHKTATYQNWLPSAKKSALHPRTAPAHMSGRPAAKAYSTRTEGCCLRSPGASPLRLRPVPGRRWQRRVHHRWDNPSRPTGRAECWPRSPQRGGFRPSR